MRTSAVGNCFHGTLDEAQILSVVNDGLTKAAESCGSELYLSEIVYVENDTLNRAGFAGDFRV